MFFHARILRWRFFLCLFFLESISTLLSKVPNIKCSFQKVNRRGKKIKRRDDFFIWAIIILSINGVDLLRAVRMLFCFLFVCACVGWKWKGIDKKAFVNREKNVFKVFFFLFCKCGFDRQNWGRHRENVSDRGGVKKKHRSISQRSLNGNNIECNSKTYEFETRDTSHWKGRLTIAWCAIKPCSHT